MPVAGPAHIRLPSDEAGLEAFVREVAYTLPTCDFGSVVAVKAMAAALRRLSPGTANPPAWGRDRMLGNTIAILDHEGDLLAIVMPGRAGAAEIIAQAPMMRALLRELLFGPVELDVWGRVAACINGGGDGP